MKLAKQSSARQHTVAMFSFDNDPPGWWYETWVKREGFRQLFVFELRMALGWRS